MIRGRDQHVVVSASRAVAERRSPAPRTHAAPPARGRPMSAPRTRSTPAPRKTAEHGEHRARRRKPKRLRPPRGRRRDAPRNRTAGHDVLRALPAGDVIRQEDPAANGAASLFRKRAVRPPRSMLSECPEGEPPTPSARRRSAGPQHDVRTASRQNSAAGERGLRCLRQRAHEVEPDSPRDPGDRERVELEAGLRNQLRLDAAARPGERHLHPALAQRFADRERWSDVPRCSARCDQTHELGRRFHSRRC